MKDGPRIANGPGAAEYGGGPLELQPKLLTHSVAPIAPLERRAVVYILQATMFLKGHRGYQANMSAPASSSSTSEIRLWNSSAAVTVFPSSTAKGSPTVRDQRGKATVAGYVVYSRFYEEGETRYLGA